MQYWTSEAIFDVQCPKCQHVVEFYKDDTTRKCGFCGHRFVNPKMDFGCATYCQFAEQCLGTLPEDFAGVRENLLKDKVAVEVKRYWKSDFKSIRRTLAAANYAETIGKRAGGNMAIVLCAAYVFDIGLSGCRTVLEKAGANAPMIEEICRILNEVSTAAVQSPEGRIVHDALLLRTAREKIRENAEDVATVQKWVEPSLLTVWSKELLQEPDWLTR